jgi:hypothetical protein
MTITRTAIVDDSGGGNDGTGLDNAWKQELYDQIDAAVAAGGGVDVGICEGRLTLTTAVPVTTADVTGATSIKWTPYKGNAIALYSGSAWVLRAFAETSLALGTLTSGLPYDVFAYDNAGTLGLRAPVAWTNGTTRATALVLQDGVLVKTGATTDRYLGTFYTTSTTTTEDSAAKRYVWNYYNRVPRVLQRLETAATWTYTTGVTRQANGNTANQVAVVIGWAESLVALTIQSMASNTSTGVAILVGIGIDSTTTMASSGGTLTVSIANGFGPLIATLHTLPTVGMHFYSWNEFSVATGTTTFYGQDAPSANTGLIGSVL